MKKYMIFHKKANWDWEPLQYHKQSVPTCFVCYMYYVLCSCKVSERKENTVKKIIRKRRYTDSIY